MWFKTVLDWFTRKQTHNVNNSSVEFYGLPILRPSRYFTDGVTLLEAIPSS